MLDQQLLHRELPAATMINLRKKCLSYYYYYDYYHNQVTSMTVLALLLFIVSLVSATTAFQHRTCIPNSPNYNGIVSNPRRVPYASVLFKKSSNRIVDTRCAATLFPTDDGISSVVTTIVTSYQESWLSSSMLTSASAINIDDQQVAEELAGPLFGASLIPYLAFLYLLNVKENDTPKGVTVGFATCLLFVFLTIPAAIASQQLYGVSLADCDWLHGSAESLLTITNLVTILAFRQALQWRGSATPRQQKEDGDIPPISLMKPPKSAISYQPMISLVGVLTALAAVTALVPALSFDSGTTVHTPYLGGFMDLPPELVATYSRHAEPENSLTVACWIIHWSSLVEFLVAMGFAWRWADVVGNQRWKGITWGLLPLHSSGITACTYHIFYNNVPLMVPLQAFLTLFGNTTAAYAAYRLALSNGWDPQSFLSAAVGRNNNNKYLQQVVDDGSTTTVSDSRKEKKDEVARISTSSAIVPNDDDISRSSTLIGFEDLGDALSQDTDYTFLIKLFFGCAIASYAVKYAELQVDFPFWTSSEERLTLALLFVFIPSALNAFKWYQRSRDPSFEGWF